MTRRELRHHTPFSELQPYGDAHRWSRDTSLLGGWGALVATVAFWPFIELPAVDCVLAAAALALVTGVVGGALVPPVLARLGEVRVAVVWVLSIIASSVWGSAVGATAAFLVSQDPLELASHVRSGAGIGALVGVFQFSGWWLPYLWRSSQRRATWPITVAAMATTGTAALLTLVAGSP